MFKTSAALADRPTLVPLGAADTLLSDAEGQLLKAKGSLLRAGGSWPTQWGLLTFWGFCNSVTEISSKRFWMSSRNNQPYMSQILQTRMLSLVVVISNWPGREVPGWRGVGGRRTTQGNSMLLVFKDRKSFTYIPWTAAKIPHTHIQGNSMLLLSPPSLPFFSLPFGDWHFYFSYTYQ